MARIPVGAVYLVPLANGRFTACRVVEVRGESRRPAAREYRVVMSAWVGMGPPPLDEPAVREPLRLTHHAHRNRLGELWFSGPPPAEFHLLGTIEPAAAERDRACGSYSGWEFVPDQALRQWRWDHDRAAVEAEDAEEARRQREQRDAAAAAERRRLGALTLPQFRRRPRFAGWADYVPAAALRAARQHFADAADALLALGPTAPEPLKLDVLRGLIEAFNRLDERHECLDTIEREDIGEEFRALLSLVGLDGYGELADMPGRDW